MNTFFAKLKSIFTDKNLRKRVLFMAFFLVVFRMLAAIPIPGVDQARLANVLAGNQLFSILNVFSGGGLSTFSIIMLGVGPYITASIIMQLLTIMVPRLKEMYQEEGDRGRIRFAQYSRMLAVPLAVLQGFTLVTLLARQGVIAINSPFAYVVNLLVITGGSILLMWIGELLSEFGIGNGVSFLIFAGIVAAIPTHIAQLQFTLNSSQAIELIAYAVAGLALIAGVVFITEAERPIPVSYARQVRGDRVIGGGATFIPLKMNQAGVIPIIFALSILLFPQLAASFLSGLSYNWAHVIANGLTAFLQNSWLYAVVYFALVVLFTYFYTAVTFDPEQMSTNLQKSGAFVPGIRPGQATTEYISRIVTRITLVGAVSLGFIAVFPLIMKSITGITSLALGGTALLIVVSVVIDLIKRIDAQLSMKEY